MMLFWPPLMQKPAQNAAISTRVRKSDLTKHFLPVLQSCASSLAVALIKAS
jgi:hypothetical protein